MNVDEQFTEADSALDKEYEEYARYKEAEANDRFADMTPILL